MNFVLRIIFPESSAYFIQHLVNLLDLKLEYILQSFFYKNNDITQASGNMESWFNPKEGGGQIVPP